MQILIVASTEMEIALFREQFQEADILITGVGVPSAVYHIAKRLHQIDYDLVIQAGIAGAFSPGLNGVFQVMSDRFADIGFRNGDEFTSVYQMGLTDGNIFPYKDGWLNNNKGFFFDLKFPAVKAITVNAVTSDQDFIQSQVKLYGASLESMEGAALHYVCLMEDVPFIQLRSVSNLVGERNKDRWDFEGAVTILNDELIKIFKKLNEFKHE